MTNINKGIINTGSIGGNASVTVTDYGSGNVIAPGSVVDIKQRAQKVERELQAEGGPDATELAAVKAALVQLTRKTAEAADAAHRGIHSAPRRDRGPRRRTQDQRGEERCRARSHGPRRRGRVETCRCGTVGRETRDADRAR